MNSLKLLIKSLIYSKFTYRERYFRPLVNRVLMVTSTTNGREWLLNRKRGPDVIRIAFEQKLKLVYISKNTAIISLHRR